jgi:hypothetical protein
LGPCIQDDVALMPSLRIAHAATKRRNSDRTLDLVDGLANYET